jgi:hypothetical protein
VGGWGHKQGWEKQVSHRLLLVTQFVKDEGSVDVRCAPRSFPFGATSAYFCAEARREAMPNRAKEVKGRGGDESR